MRRSMQLAFQRRWWSLLSVALHNSIATALDPTLDIAEGTFPVASASGYGIRRPSAPYRLAAHNWTCDRAPIALEKYSFLALEISSFSDC